MRSEVLREFWDYRELFLFLVWKDVKVRYKQTMLGASWAVIQPFLTMVVFTLFFGKFANMPSDGIPYPIFSYSALLPWTYFSGALSLAGNSLVANKNLLTKVYFPRVAIPASSVLCGLVDFSIAFLVLLVMMAYYGIMPTWELLLWPVLILPLMFLALGGGMVLAALNVRYRDIKHAIPFAVQILLFISPIIYPTSVIPERYRALMALNPLVGIIDAFRATVLPTHHVDWQQLGISMLTCLGVFLVGLFYFRRAEKHFADVI